MKITNCFILLLFVVITSFTAVSADVDDIDADVIANVTFNDNVGGDKLIQDTDITWNATYSGYLYFFAHDSYFGVNSVINDFGGTPNDNIELGIMDDNTFAGHELRGWRIGYVHAGTIYNITGSIYEPGTDECGGGVGAYFRDHTDWSYSGENTGHEVILSPGCWDACSGDYNSVGFLLIEAPSPESTLSGYVTNNLGNPVSSSTITLNNSGGTNTSNDTGYYEIPGITSGTYSITATSPTHDDYSDIVSIIGDTEKNILLTRKLPILSVTNIYPEKNEMLLTWTRNIVVSDVKVFKGTNTNLIATVESGSYLTGYYQDLDVECDTEYNYWLQPIEDDVTGSKYALSDTTDDCFISVAPPIINPIPTEVPDGDDENVDDGEGGNGDGDGDKDIIEIIDGIFDDIIGFLDDIIEFFDEAIIEPIDEIIIEPIRKIVNNVMTYVGSTFNWLLLGFVYLSTLVGRIFSKKTDITKIIIDTLLYGTIGIILILLLNLVGFSFIFSNELLAMIIFIIVGLMFGILPEFIGKEENDLMWK